jgi:cellulose synthase/poly-beta-1,6-N-acetylglucosamine synthase-like glycosyltransferase
MPMPFFTNRSEMVVYFAWAFFLVSIWLSIYGGNALILTLLYLFRRITKKDKPPLILPPNFSWPEVTIQLPVYNEPIVVRRLINSAARINYPLDKLVIQVLDDSTDETTLQAEELVEYWKSRGRRISLIHRSLRSEYKAGALRNGLAQTSSEFVAIFDADFIPNSNWLKKALDPFFEPDGKSVGMVQTRWVHLNEMQSPLSRAQALLLDGHFGIEQRVRSDEGLFFGFNGTAGIWRRQCILDGGGWRGDTLSEDLDLSYRAQLKGWKFRYLPDVVAPAELPTTMSAFKIQQFRWAKGSMQAVRKTVPRILQAPVSFWKKWEGLVHISGFSVHPLMVCMVLLSLPLSLSGKQALKDLPMAWLGIGSLGAPLLFAAAEWSLYPKRSWWKRFAWLPLLTMLGTGVAVSNTKAVFSGLLNIRSPFQRTPKTGTGPLGRRYSHASREPVTVDTITWLELGLAVYSLLVVVIDIRYRNWFSAAFLSIYAAGFAWVALATLWEAFAPWLIKILSPEQWDTQMD